MINGRYYEAPESVKYHGGYDPSDPPQYDDEALSDDEELQAWRESDARNLPEL